MNVSRTRVSVLIAIGILLLWCISAFLGAIFWSNELNDLQHLSSIVYHEWGYATFPINTTLEELWMLRGVFTMVFVITTTALAVTWIRKGHLWSHLYGIFTDIPSSIDHLIAPLRVLSGVQRLILSAFFIGIVAIRLFFMIEYPPHTDEVASYDMFVSQSALAVTSYYPIPNNHIFFNLVCRAFHSLNSSFTWTMRAPSFLIGLLGSCLFFLILLRHGGFFIAVMAVMLFNSSSLGIFQLFAGRGYALIFLLCGIAFFVMIRICDERTARPWHWFVFTLANILGFYTVPTYFYAFLSVSLFGAFALLFSRNWNGLLNMVGAGCVIVVATVFLYLPVIMVSGVGSLFANKYVEPKTWSDALRELPNYVADMENQLIGIHDLPMSMIFVLPVLIGWMILSRWRTDRWLLLLGWGCVVMFLLPYLASLIQRVHPPDRVLYYKEFFLFLLFALVVDQLLIHLRSSAVWRHITLIIPVAFMVHQTIEVDRMKEELAATMDRINDVHQHLKEAQAQRVQVVGSYYEFYLLHFARQEDLQVQFFSGHEERPDIDHMVIIRDELEKIHVDTSQYRLGYSTEEVVVYHRDLF